MKKVLAILLIIGFAWSCEKDEPCECQKQTEYRKDYSFYEFTGYPDEFEIVPCGTPEYDWKFVDYQKNKRERVICY